MIEYTAEDVNTLIHEVAIVLLKGGAPRDLTIHHIRIAVEAGVEFQKKQSNLQIDDLIEAAEKFKVGAINAEDVPRYLAAYLREVRKTLTRESVAEKKEGV